MGEKWRLEGIKMVVYFFSSNTILYSLVVNQAYLLSSVPAHWLMICLCILLAYLVNSDLCIPRFKHTAVCNLCITLLKHCSNATYISTVSTYRVKCRKTPIKP